MAEQDTLLAWLHPNHVSACFDDCKDSLFRWDELHDFRIADRARVRCATGGVPEGRNQVAGIMVGGQLDWLFFIDADMGFPPDVLDRLHAYADPVERPIVGGLCFAQREIAPDGLGGFHCHPMPTLYDWVHHDDGLPRFTGRRHYEVNRLVRVAATGTACLLVHRSVFEAIQAKFGDKWFDRTLGSDGSMLGEDISFCMRAGALDIPIHVHTGIRITHHKETWVGEIDFWRRVEVPPATEDVDVIVPVLHRPQNVKPFTDSLRASTGRATAWFVCEPGDDIEQDAVLANGGRVLEYPGSFAQKVNFGYRNTSAPWVFLAGDDVQFKPAWLDHAQMVGDRYEAAVVGTNDLGNPRVMRGEHATHMMIRRSYIDEVGASWDGPGVVAHEGYRHWYVDDEIVNAAKLRGVWQMALGSIVEHLHPIFGKADDDDVYRLGQASSSKDRAIFEARASKHLRAA